MLRQLSLQHRIFVCKIYFNYDSARRVRDAFVQQFPDEVPPSLAQIHVIANKFDNTGSVLNKKHARTRTVLTEDELDDIGENLERSPNKSLTKLAQVGVSVSSTCLLYTSPSPRD